MDQGIIQNTKIHYRRRVVDRKLDAIEYDYEYVEIDIKTAIEYLVEAWREVTPQTIRNCWRKADFVEPTSPSTSEIVELDSDSALEKYNESCRKLKEKENFDQEEFLNIDNNLICVETFQTDEEIIATLTQSEGEKGEEDGEEEEVGIPTPAPKIITKREARDLIEQLQQFFYSNPNDCCSEISKLQQIKESLKNYLTAKQATIESFFTKS